MIDVKEIQTRRRMAQVDTCASMGLAGSFDFFSVDLCDGKKSKCACKCIGVVKQIFS